MNNAMDKLLRETLAAYGRDGAPPTACLDADTAAALADGALPPRDRHAAEAHLAGCARCQAIVAALARTLPPVSPRVWWRRPAFVWLAPLTAVGAALVVWAAVPQRESTSLPAQPSAAVTPPASGPSAAPPGREEQSREQLQQQQLARSEAVPLNAPPPPAAAAPGGLTALRAPAANDQRDLSSQQDAKLMRQRTFADSSATQNAIPPAAAPASPAVSETQAAVARAAPAPPPAPQPLPSTPLPLAAAGERAATADAAEPLAITESVTIAPSAARQSRAQFKTDAAAIASPDGSSQWRIARAGTVQHSADGGATWQAQPTGVNVPLTGGMAPARAVCWLIGQRGTVLLTVNVGRTWQRLNFPVAVDLRSVHATDDKTASVVAADGRVFSTADGGNTWQTR